MLMDRVMVLQYVVDSMAVVSPETSCHTIPTADGTVSGKRSICHSVLINAGVVKIRLLKSVIKDDAIFRCSITTSLIVKTNDLSQ